jgi:glycosyltransferase involved in cell wall biosynthesis
VHSAKSDQSSGGSDAPDVSVVLATYNHAPYIAKAIESVLRQSTARPFELIISDDASTDGTREIVDDAASRDSRIRTIFSDRNLRSNEVVARGIRAARGRYVCLLDGDDHWLASDKLERQAALLDSNPEASACFGNARIVRGRAEQPTSDSWTPRNLAKRVNLEEIWRGNPFATSASMLRRDALANLGDWYADFFPVTDWPLYILCAERGDLLFFDEPVAAYRLHTEGLFSALPDRSKLALISRFYRDMNRATERRWQRYARRGQAMYLLDWADTYAARGDRGMARAYSWEALRSGAVVHERGLLRRWARSTMRILAG